MGAKLDPKPFRARDYLTGDEFEVAPTSAGWWQTSPRPHDLGPYYPNAYYGDGGRRFPALVEWFQGLLYRQRARVVTRAVRRPGRALDIGCGPGHLLAALRRRGWAVIGTEATPESAAIAEKRNDVEVLVGETALLSLAPESLDAIISWHSLEHVTDPARTLDACRDLLRPGGVLLVSVPDFGSPEAQAKRGAWFHLDVPRHLNHFPAAVLRRALEARGFRIEDDHRCAPEYDTFSLLQTWQNRLGLPHNLLYLLLKRQTRAAAQPSSPAEKCAAVLLALGLGPAALLLSLIRTLNRTGSVVVLLARKPLRAG